MHVVANSKFTLKEQSDKGLHCLPRPVWLKFWVNMFIRSQLIWIYTLCKGRTYLGSAGSGLNNSTFFFLFNSYNYAYIHSSHNVIIQFLAFCFSKISCKWSILYCGVLAGKNNLTFFFLSVSSSLLSSVFKRTYGYMYNTILTFCLLCNMYICIYWGHHGRLAITCICVGAKCCNPQKIKLLLTYLLVCVMLSKK